MYYKFKNWDWKRQQRGIQKLVVLKPRSSFEKSYILDKYGTYRKNSKRSLTAYHAAYFSELLYRQYKLIFGIYISDYFYKRLSNQQQIDFQINQKWKPNFFIGQRVSLTLIWEGGTGGVWSNFTLPVGFPLITQKR